MSEYCMWVYKMEGWANNYMEYKLCIKTSRVGNIMCTRADIQLKVYSNLATFFQETCKEHNTYEFGYRTCTGLSFSDNVLWGEG